MINQRLSLGSAWLTSTKLNSVKSVWLNNLKIIWRIVCVLLYLPLGCYWLRQALLNSLTTSSPLTWKEASRPPQVTCWHVHTIRPTFPVWKFILWLALWSFAGMLLSLNVSNTYSMQPVDTSPIPWASSPDEFDVVLFQSFGNSASSAEPFSGKLLVRNVMYLSVWLQCTVAHLTHFATAFCWFSFIAVLRNN